jgi:hypothetical protein
MMTHRKFGRRRDEINDCWNGSAHDHRDMIWPYWVIGFALVAIVGIAAWGVSAA